MPAELGKISSRTEGSNLSPHETDFANPRLLFFQFFLISFFFPKSPLQKAFFLSEALMGYCLIFLRSLGDMQIKWKKCFREKRENDEDRAKRREEGFI